VSASPAPFGRSWGRTRTRFTDLRWYGAPERGGHFVAFEPAVFVDEVRGFFRTVR
jgi:hypothetical protein